MMGREIVVGCCRSRVGGLAEMDDCSSQANGRNVFEGPSGVNCRIAGERIMWRAGQQQQRQVCWTCSFQAVCGERSGWWVAESCWRVEGSFVRALLFFFFFFFIYFTLKAKRGRKRRLLNLAVLLRGWSRLRKLTDESIQSTKQKRKKTAMLDNTTQCNAAEQSNKSSSSNNRLS